MNVLAALGYAVFECSAPGYFRLSDPAPAWLPTGSPCEAFPFLEVFLPDAEEFWASPRGRAALYSDFWTQASPAGEDLRFCAIAVASEPDLLLIECVDHRFREMQSYVQYAHEVSLAREQIAKLSRELEHATQAKSEFLARMSHEIRTPLNALLGMAELLAETKLDEKQAEYVRVFRRAGDNLLSVINEILDFSKVEAGKIELENVVFDLEKVVTEAVEIACVRARAKGLEVSSRIQPGVPVGLIGDPARLRQVLLNLLGNAVKFTERGRIAVLIETDADRPALGSLRFAVSDTGSGIPADRLSTIFDSFSQADVSTSRQYGGTGLGLAICKRFVELMGGRIWAESTPGAGSTIRFTARFAVAEEPGRSGAGATTAKDGEAARATIPRGLRVLLADDSDENRFLIREYLKETGCVLDEVENGALAVQKFNEQRYDVVLMDSDMPVLDGYGATGRIRALEAERQSPAVPILALTAHAFLEAKARSIEAGCTAHLTKPIKKSTLFKAIGATVPTSVAREPVKVAVEDWLKPVVGGYLDNRRADIGRLRDALEQGDYSTIRLLGHRMAGTGGGYGFGPITDIGNTLEESALAGDISRMRASIDDLDRYLQSIQL